MEHNATYLGFIPLLPLSGALILGLMHLATCQGKKISEKLYGILGCVGPFISFILAVKVFLALKGLPGRRAGADAAGVHLVQCR